MANSLTHRWLPGRASLTVPSLAPWSEGDVLASWPAVGLDLPWGVGYTGDVWLSDPIDNGDAVQHRPVSARTTAFTSGGEPTST